jgi:hypothetical protein
MIRQPVLCRAIWLREQHKTLAAFLQHHFFVGSPAFSLQIKIFFAKKFDKLVKILKRGFERHIGGFQQKPQPLFWISTPN